MVELGNCSEPFMSYFVMSKELELSSCNWLYQKIIYHITTDMFLVVILALRFLNIWYIRQYFVCLFSKYGLNIFLIFLFHPCKLREISLKISGHLSNLLENSLF